MAQARARDKRCRLVEAARVLFHRQGYSDTSLADIARESGVPVGNVYYYFKTKEDIAATVIEELRQRLAEMAHEAESLPSARERIIALLDSLEYGSEEVAAHGCPMGSFCMEFAKRDFALREDANRLLLKMFDWLERQLRDMGRDDARALAIQIWSTVQGSSLLALAMQDADVLRHELERLKELVRTL